MKLTFPLLNTTIHVPVDESVTGGKTSRRSLTRRKIDNKIPETEKVSRIEEVSAPESKEPEKAPEKPEEKVNAADPASQAGSQPLLMVEVVNITHEKFRQTEEIKVKCARSFRIDLPRVSLFR